MWNPMTKIFDNKSPQKNDGSETYTSADAPAALSPSDTAGGEATAETQSAEWPVVGAPGTEPNASADSKKSLQQQLADRDTILGTLLVESMVVLRTFQAELVEAESGLVEMSTRVSALEATEAETTQQMASTFQKDAQQRLELKQAKAREKAQDQEIATIKAEMLATRKDLEAARARIKELEDGHLASIIDRSHEDDDLSRASKHHVTGVAYGASPGPGSRVSGGATKGGVNLAGKTASPHANGTARGGNIPVNGAADAGDVDDAAAKAGRLPPTGPNGVSEAPTAKPGGCCVLS